MRPIASDVLVAWTVLLGTRLNVQKRAEPQVSRFGGQTPVGHARYHVVDQNPAHQPKGLLSRGHVPGTFGTTDSVHNTDSTQQVGTCESAVCVRIEYESNRE